MTRTNEYTLTVTPENQRHLASELCNKYACGSRIALDPEDFRNTIDGGSEVSVTEMYGDSIGEILRGFPSVAPHGKALIEINTNGSYEVELQEIAEFTNWCHAQPDSMELIWGFGENAAIQSPLQIVIITHK